MFFQILGGDKTFRKNAGEILLVAWEGPKTFRSRFGSFFGSFIACFQPFFVSNEKSGGSFVLQACRPNKQKPVFAAMSMFYLECRLVCLFLFCSCCVLCCTWLLVLVSFQPFHNKETLHQSSPLFLFFLFGSLSRIHLCLFLSITSCSGTLAALIQLTALFLSVERCFGLFSTNPLLAPNWAIPRVRHAKRRCRSVTARISYM